MPCLAEAWNVGNELDRLQKVFTRIRIDLSIFKLNPDVQDCRNRSLQGHEPFPQATTYPLPRLSLSALELGVIVMSGYFDHLLFTGRRLPRGSAGGGSANSYLVTQSDRTP